MTFKVGHSYVFRSPEDSEEFSYTCGLNHRFAMRIGKRPFLVTRVEGEWVKEIEFEGETLNGMAFGMSYESLLHEDELRFFIDEGVDNWQDFGETIKRQLDMLFNKYEVRVRRYGTDDGGEVTSDDFIKLLKDCDVSRRRQQRIDELREELAKLEAEELQ